MIRKIIVRGLLTCFLLALVAIGVVVYAISLAKSEPEFYSALRKQEFTQGAQKLAEMKLKLMESNIEKWAISSVMKQKKNHLRQSRKSEPTQKFRVYDPASDKHVCRFSQDELNALFSTIKESRDGPQHIRAQIENDLIQLAGEWKLPDSSTSVVVSGSFKISHTADKLKLEIVGGQIGQLPIPLVWLLQKIPNEIFTDVKDCEVHFSDNNPHLLFELPGTNQSKAILQTIATKNSEIELTFGAPMVAF